MVQGLALLVERKARGVGARKRETRGPTWRSVLSVRKRVTPVEGFAYLFFVDASPFWGGGRTATLIDFRDRWVSGALTLRCEILSLG